VVALFVPACSDSGNRVLTSPTPAAAAIPPSTPTISGRVSAVSHGTAWTPQTGTAVAGVRVEEANSHQSAITDANGSFTLTGGSGPFLFSVSKAGYFDRQSSAIPAGATYVELRIDAKPATYTLTGRVYEITSEGRTVVEDVLIQGSFCDNGYCWDDQLATTDRNGFYSATMYAGPNILWVSKEGYHTDPPTLPDCDFCNIAVTVSGDTRLDIQLVRR
jgi:hypothetical protein